jgi:hypothetical protein
MLRTLSRAAGQEQEPNSLELPREPKGQDAARRTPTQPRTPDSCNISTAGDGPGPWTVDRGPWDDGMSSGEAARTPYSCLHSAYRVLLHSSIRRRSGGRARHEISRRHAVPPTTPPRRPRHGHASGAWEWSVVAGLSCRAALVPAGQEESARREEGDGGALWGRGAPVPEPTVPGRTPGASTS